jgi:amino acid adenylation domain-containing protein
LPTLEVQYGDFSVWQAEWFQGERLERALGFWKAELQDAPTVLELPFDRQRPAFQSDLGAHCRGVVGRDSLGDLEALGRDEGATLFMALLATFSALLARYSGQRDLIVGTPIANRSRVELEHLIGFFANTLALRVDLSGNPSFRELLRRTRDTALRAFSNQDLPFEKLVAELNPERSLSHSPLFQVLFQFHETMTEGDRLPDLELQRVDLDRQRAKFDLALTLSRGDDGLNASFEYSTDLFESTTIERLMASYENLLRAVVAEPERPLEDLAVIGETEAAQLARWDDTFHAYPERDRCVHELVEEQVRRSPNAVAATIEDRAITYAELNTRANRLARQLRELGVGPDVPVAICLQRSLALPVAALAALKAGGAYTPLEPSYPAERLRFMLESSGARVLLTESDFVDRFPNGGAQVICLDHEMDSDVEAGDEADLTVVGGPENLAYILFTSGSTGTPKGVAMPHRTLSNLLAWQRDHFSSEPAGRTLQFASISFDVAFQELFSTWICGGTLILVDDETRRDPALLLEALSAQRVERLFAPYILLQHLAETALEVGKSPPSLREVITAGEALQITPAIREFFSRLPACRLHNQYGPTESHVVTAYALQGTPHSWPERPPIGRPITNAVVRVLDERGRRLPVGVPGEICIGGEVLARGYLGRDDLTAERFVPDAFSDLPGARLYRTGDRARLRADGNLEFLGRLDQQVKVRGYRIEPGEIEVQLAHHPSVREVLVVAREDEPGDRRLVGYVVTQGDLAAEDAESELKAFLGTVLPEYMVPSAIITLDAFPLSPNGKVDRSALPAVDHDGGKDGFVPPRSPTEQVVARVWGEVLRVEPVGADHNFFALGGHSLLATRVVSRLRAAFDVEIGLRSIFEHPTVAGLAAVIDTLVGDNQRARGLVLRSVDRREHRVVPPSSGRVPAGEA